MKKIFKTILIGSVAATLVIAATALGSGSVQNAANLFKKYIHTVTLFDTNDQLGDSSNRIPAIYVNALNSSRGNIAADSVSASAVNANTTNSHTVNASTTNSTNINATTTNSTNVNATTVNATTVTATTVAATTVTATTVNASSVPASAVNGSAITLTPATTRVMQTYGYTGSVQTWKVPFNVSGTVSVTVKGANGYRGVCSNDIGGFGGYAQGTLSSASSTIGSVYYFNVGQAATSYLGGYGGGGNGINAYISGGIGGGGGGTWFSATSTFSTSTVALVGSGGGGAGGYTSPCTDGSGGNGGGSIGLNGHDNFSNRGGGGGTQTAGGANGGGAQDGSAYQGGNSNGGNPDGGGGSGYFGGGGGGRGGGGGGGSSFASSNLAATSTDSLSSNGNGSITFDYDTTANNSAIQSNAGGGCLVLGAASGTPSSVYAYFDSNGALYATTTKPSFCE